MKRRFLIFTATALFVIGASACTQKVSISRTERRTLEENPFAGQSTFNPNEVMGGINPHFEDAFYPSNESFAYGEGNMFGPSVEICTRERYDIEFKQAIEDALADATGKTIVVAYQISTGTPVDNVAKLANFRAILNKDDDGITPFYQGVANQFRYKGNKAHVVFTHHSEAKEDYKSGRNCFFSTVKIIAEKEGGILARKGTLIHELPGDDQNPNIKLQYNHAMALMYHDDTARLDDVDKVKHLNRLIRTNEENVELFKKALSDYQANGSNGSLSDFIEELPLEEYPQTLRLFVADLRDPWIQEHVPEGHSFKGKEILNHEFASSAVRRKHYWKGYKEIFDLIAIWDNMQILSYALSQECEDHNGFESVPQLLHNIIFAGGESLIMPVQYTPIVMDVPKGKTIQERALNRGILTSSLLRGSFFDIANIGLRHLTAWLGGIVSWKSIDFGDGNIVDWEVLEAKDALLALPKVERNPDNSIKGYSIEGAEQLFGNYRDGKEYENGFESLKELVNETTSFPKRCNETIVNDNGTLVSGSNDSPPSGVELKHYYLGKWDGEIWEQLMLWFDRNRNGHLDSGEMEPFSHYFDAFNLCYIHTVRDENGNLVPTSDRHGNLTRFRAAALVKDIPGVEIAETEILNRLETGKTSAGASAEFSVGIDLEFKTNPDFFLNRNKN